MKLVVAVVRDEYAGAAAESLTRAGYSATKLASTGGFLKAGNSTFLVGVDAEKVPAVMEILRAACPGKPAPSGPSGGVTVGGATIFVLGVDRMIKV